MSSFELKGTSCKLCREAILDKNFKVIDDLTKGILNIPLLTLKLHDDNKYVMCSYCCKNLNAALEFKSTCLCTNDTIIPYVDSEKMLQLDLREIYIMEKKTEQLNGISEDQKVCRLCMQLVKNDFRYIHLEEIVAIQKLVPEININIVKDPIVCNQCFGSLSTHNRFLKRCFEVDEKIGQISDISFIKKEENNQLPLDLLVKTERLDEESEMNKTELSLKVEPIEIKSEENGKVENDISLLDDEFADGEIVNTDGTNLHELKQKDSLNMYKYDISDFITKLKNNLLQQQLKHKDFSEVQVYKCDKCDFRAKWKCYLKRHILVHQDISEVQIYKCDSCDFITKYKDSLREHQLKHKDFSEVQVYKCDTCDFRAKNKKYLRRHILVHQDISELQIYKCDACDFKTRYKQSCRTHQLTHKDFSEVQVYKCDICNYKTKYDHSFKIHQLKHNPVQMYKCDKCNFKTIYKKNFATHQLKHKNFSEVQMYKCDTCDFKTKYNQNLRSHLLTHKDFSEVQVYKCYSCDYITRYKGHLIQHQMIHKDFPEEQKYKCDACGYSTKYKFVLKKHLLKHKDANTVTSTFTKQ